MLKSLILKIRLLFSFVVVSHSVISDSMQPHGLQHTRLPCPSLSPRVCSNSCPLSWWCHPIISSSVSPFSFCPQSFPASRSFPVSQLFTSAGQSIGVLELQLHRQSFQWRVRVDFLLDWLVWSPCFYNPHFLCSMEWCLKLSMWKPQN